MTVAPRHVAPELLAKVTKALGITAIDQWYYVSQHAINQAVGARTLNKLGGTLGFLKAAYPRHHFDEEKLSSRKKLEKDQKFIEVIIRKLFPDTEIHTKAKKSIGIRNPETDAYLEIDFWMPSLKLGIEYQDKHHYEYQWYANTALADYQKRDDIKRVTMSNLGYTLITIGCWWDKTLESVVATIRNVRPDLLQDFGDVAADPIPLDPPPGYFSKASVIPGVAGLMSPFIPLYNFNPTNWYAGEKHDGVRGVYNFELHKMFSRSGNELSIIPSLMNDIPAMLVEGEITAGRGNYNRTTAVSYHSHPEKVNWPMFRYVLYDIPDVEFGNYTRRYSAITSGLSAHPYIFAQPAYRVLVANKDHLKMLVDCTISDYGEGMIVQKDAPYEHGRAKGLAKIKLRRDADARVLHLGEFSCTCKLISGVAVDIDFRTDFDPSTVKEGDIVSYYHNGYTQNGSPKHAEIYKVRYDVNWDELVSDQVQPSVNRRSSKEAIGSSALIERNSTRNKMGHWSRTSNARVFFDQFAQEAGFDPLVPENWYSVKVTPIKEAMGGTGMLKAYNYNLQKAITSAYAELKFDTKRFKVYTKRAKNHMGYWKKLQNVRDFLDSFARNAGFDPLVPANWYPVRIRTVRAAGGGGLLNAFRHSLANALTKGYPDLMFDSSKFLSFAKVFKKGFWKKLSNVRGFFNNFAKKQGFDPLVPENWYPVRIRALTKAGYISPKGNGGFMKALISAYPELTFDVDKFRTLGKVARQKRGHWSNNQNVTAFFDEFARKAGFDPLIPANWYKFGFSDIKKAQGEGVLNANGKSLKKALSRAYPDLKFEEEFKSRFKALT